MGNRSTPLRHAQGGCGKFRIKRKPSDMRVSDYVLKSVGFVVELTQVDSGEEYYDPFGTGFFISIPSTENGYFLCFVTAKHVIQPLINRKIGILVNGKDGNVIVLPTMDNGVWYNKKDPSADVAVIICNQDPSIDIIPISIVDFIQRPELQSRKIGIGDEVYMTGLFAPIPWQQRHMPIVRHGNIAMIPDEPIQLDEGYSDVYLIEARSIGGVSGSPVFVRETIKLAGERDAIGSGNPGELHGLGRTYLLGLMHGHWDIKESDKNNPAPNTFHGINMGIAVVVPADKILDIINRPELMARRNEAEERSRQERMPKPD